MLTRRHLLCAATLALLPLPAIAQQIAPAPVDEAAIIARRFMMENAYGVITTDEDLLGRYALIFFGYTFCPDVCPTTLSTIALVMEDLGANAVQIVPYFVTVDPARDTAKVLREYLSIFDPRIQGLRGPKEYTDRMVKVYNARYEFYVPDPTHPEIYSVDHTASVAFVGPDGVLIKRFPQGLSVEVITADILAEMAAWPAPEPLPATAPAN